MTECPAWEEGISIDELPAFELAVRDAISFVLTSAVSLPDSQTTRQIHRILFTDFVPLDQYAGNFRGDLASLCLAINVKVGNTAGEDFSRVNIEMERLFKFYGDALRDLELQWQRIPPEQRSPLLAVIIAQFIGRFIQIHPFVNGNGRTSRLLWLSALNRYGVPRHATITDRPGPPYGQVMAKCMLGDFTPLAFWILQWLALNPPRR